MSEAMNYIDRLRECIDRLETQNRRYREESPSMARIMELEQNVEDSKERLSLLHKEFLSLQDAYDLIDRALDIAHDQTNCTRNYLLSVAQRELDSESETNHD